ncbi:WD40 repeat-like protein [Coniophora puteana RWD-64-598 SS2]|uniref:WD40 repeat-like protein n=1 Tax=Coniophora puteana (strain RWD-64-598) TaxID=741705 RepID=A0A5M3MG51_CONPW|nr:WD40 repeat-like protein [Coniophora puteana RWD-64-598 SS2]EIW78143.1 WD40 repeat-like protein [Coniophora puteana RWD-64-598 SS2]
MSDQFELASPPFDTPSCLRFSPTNPDLLLTSAWDTSLRLYDIQTNTQRFKYDHRAAVLACTWGSDTTKAYTGGLDTGVRELDLVTEKATHWGQHDNAVSSMVYARDMSTVITGSWDESLRFWDLRSAPTGSPSSTHSVPERVYHLDISGNNLVVGMASRLFHIYDIRNMSTPAQTRESSLKFMTRSLACMADGQGYAIGSVEGRIGVEYFDPSPAVQEQKYAFKCHRQTIEDVDHVWPVNALAFHPVHNTFASAGSDGTISIWDHKLKKRLRQYPKYQTPVAAIAFNCDGTRLAVGLGYTWDDGENGARSGVLPALWIRKVGDEVKPRQAA